MRWWPRGEQLIAAGPRSSKVCDVQEYVEVVRQSIFHCSVAGEAAEVDEMLGNLGLASCMDELILEGTICQAEGDAGQRLKQLSFARPGLLGFTQNRKSMALLLHHDRSIRVLQAFIARLPSLALDCSWSEVRSH